MHVVTGGAYNGKSAWVKAYYHLDSDVHQAYWFSSYKGDNYPDPANLVNNFLVFSGVEWWVKHWLQQVGMERIREKGQQMIHHWLQWEQQAAERQLVVIGSDISKGIVPMEKEMRDHRDAAGWFFQDLTTSCSRLDLVWYGIAKQLK